MRIQRITCLDLKFSVYNLYLLSLKINTDVEQSVATFNTMDTAVQVDLALTPGELKPRIISSAHILNNGAIKLEWFSILILQKLIQLVLMYASQPSSSIR